PERDALLAAAADHAVMARREPGDLQLGIVLVRPEPWPGMIFFRPTHQGRSDGLALVDGIADALHPHPAALPGEGSAISRRKDAGVGSAAGGVHPYAVLDGQPGRFRKLDIGHDADADNHEIDSEFGAVAQPGGAHAPIPDQGCKPGSLANLDAMR